MLLPLSVRCLVVVIIFEIVFILLKESYCHGHVYCYQVCKLVLGIYKAHSSSWMSTTDMALRKPKTYWQRSEKTKWRITTVEQSAQTLPRPRSNPQCFMVEHVSWFDVERASVSSRMAASDGLMYITFYKCSTVTLAVYFIPFLRYCQFYAEMTLLGDCDL